MYKKTKQKWKCWTLALSFFSVEELWIGAHNTNLWHRDLVARFSEFKNPSWNSFDNDIECMTQRCLNK